MDLDDLEPRRPVRQPKDLSGWSVEQLEEYTALLEAEIGRARAVIATKRSHKAAADSLFRKPS
jgi:uncharacterized small protein (DUF1192 family)